jgi:hypothetical protein
LLVSQQVFVVSGYAWDLMLLGELSQVIRQRRYPRNFGIHAIDALVGIHVKLGNKPAANQADVHAFHLFRSLFAEFRNVAYVR